MRPLLRRLAYFLRRGRFEAELREEMDFHREMLAHRRPGGGGFGNATLAREDARAVWGWSSVERAWQDLRYGARSLRTHPGFTCVAILTLALGIGANTAMFSVVNGVLLRPLPFAGSDRLAMVWSADPARGIREATTSFPTFDDWRHNTRAFGDLAYWRLHAGNLAGPEPERVLGAFASANLLPLLGVPPVIGRTFTSTEEQRRDPVVVVSHGLWQRRFGGVADVVGRTLDINGRRLQIVGVMPAGFYFPTRDVQHWEPATLQGAFQAKPVLNDRSWTNRRATLWNVVGRLKPGLSAADAQADLSAIGRRLAEQYPIADPDFAGYGVEVVPLLTQITGRTLERSLWILLGAVGCVLLIACANVANLLFARGAARRREFGVRVALGAGRGRLVRQLLTEHTLLAVAGGIAGTLAAIGGIRVLSASASAGVPRLDEVALDPSVLIFTAAVTLTAGLLFAVVPAWGLSRSDHGDALKEASRSATAGAGLMRLRQLLVAAECALAVALLAGAGLLIRSLVLVESVTPGFDTAHVLLVRINLPLPLSPQWRREEWETFARIHERLAGLPGVAGAGAITNFTIARPAEEAVTIEGRPAASGDGQPDVLVHTEDVTPGFFEAMGVPLLAGRFFTHDEQNAPIAIVNAAFAQRYFPSGNAIGKRFKEGGPDGKGAWSTIVGVTGNMHREGLERQPVPEYFYPSTEPTMDIAVRTAGEPGAMIAAVRDTLRSAYPGTVVIRVTTAGEIVGTFSSQRRFQTWLLALFAAAALGLAAVGVYGVTHFTVAQRTHEMGIRLALGANRADVMALILRQGMRAPLAGLAIGLLGALVLTRVLAHLVFEITTTDPFTYAAVGGILAAGALTASWLPARRAMRVDPLVALRHE
jgi:putative ABC transport system permease protein